MNRTCTFLFLLLSMFAGCRAAPKPQWTPEEIPLCSTMRLWEISRLAMHKNGFPVVHIGFDPKTREALSGWHKDLHPFKGNGFRERVHIRYKAGEKPGTLTLGVRVESQVNENLAKPLDPSYAKWVVAPDNTGRAKVVLQYIHSLLGADLNIGKTLSDEEMRRRGEDFKMPLK
ncbi:MAG: hypothetical protein ACI9F9_000180 [Candidatus Paceibacteria bacterium]|jgi:hypothetical protein